MQHSRTHLLLVLASTLLVGLGALGTARAQNAAETSDDDQGARAGGGGFFALGTDATDLQPLNDRLSGAGYPTFRSTMLSLGGGGYGIVAGRLLVGGEGHGLLTSGGGYQGRDVSLGGGYGLFTLGYLVRPTSNLRVYPQLGLGGGGLTLDIGSAGAQDFDDVLDDPNRSASLSTGGVLVSLGAGVEYLFREPDGEGSFRIGLRAGYLLPASDTGWRLGESSLSGGPNASLGGPFFRLIIGGGAVASGDE